MVERPALADVLAALSECPIDTVRGWLRGCDQQRMRPAIEATKTGGVGLCVRGYFADGTRGWLFPMRDATPAEALAALVEAELVPEHWLDAALGPRWWCEACEGEGAVSDVRRMRCWRCDGSGHAAAPPSHAALVAVVSLGPNALARAEELVAETRPARALVWRVMAAGELRKHHADHCAGLDVTPALVFSREMTPPLTNFEWRPAWPESCPYGGMFGTPDDDRHGVHRAWPALRELAALGLHLVAFDASRVVLAAEALP